MSNREILAEKQYLKNKNNNGIDNTAKIPTNKTIPEGLFPKTKPENACK